MSVLDPLAFRWTTPDPRDQGWLVFASPHSGTRLPDDMRPAKGLSEADIHSACDQAVDQLLARAPSLGVSLLTCRISRAYVDVNRAPHELDSDLIENCPQGLRPGPKTRAGYGVVPRLTGNGRDLYDRRLDYAEVEARLAGVHKPYHDLLAEQMQQVKARFGRVVLIDWHSMPARATRVGGPDVVLGDRYGTASRTETVRHLASLFAEVGWTISLNRPFAGGYATEVWGQPDDGTEAIQIELSRRLYWNEALNQPSTGWRRTQSAVNRIMAELAKFHRA